MVVKEMDYKDFDELYDKTTKKLQENIRKSDNKIIENVLKEGDDINLNKLLIFSDKTKSTTIRKFYSKVAKAINHEGFYVSTFEPGDKLNLSCIKISNDYVLRRIFSRVTNPKALDALFNTSDEDRRSNMLIYSVDDTWKKTVAILPKSVVSANVDVSEIHHTIDDAHYALTDNLQEKHGQLVSLEERFGAGKTYSITKREGHEKQDIIERVRDQPWQMEVVKIPEQGISIQGLVKTDGTDAVIHYTDDEINRLLLKSIVHKLKQSLNSKKHKVAFAEKVWKVVKPYKELETLINRYDPGEEDIKIFPSSFKHPEQVSRTLLLLTIKGAEEVDPPYYDFGTYRAKGKHITILPKGEIMMTTFDPSKFLHEALSGLNETIRSKFDENKDETREITGVHPFNGGRIYTYSPVNKSGNKKVQFKVPFFKEDIPVNTVDDGDAIRVPPESLGNYFKRAIKGLKRR